MKVGLSRMAVQPIDRYEIKKVLGKGGMAVVYLAFDPKFKRQVAIKVLLQERVTDERSRQRFYREAQAIAQLEHRAIVPVYDYGDFEGQPYLVMRYMPGGSLKDYIKRKKHLNLGEATQILARLAPALDKAHHQGIVHRDLKPGNILLDEDGLPYLSDFGIAKIIESETTLTAPQQAVGTPAYMSPEQARAEKALDGRSDIYSLTVILFEMLTGQQPYHADSAMGLAVAHINDPIPQVAKYRPDLPPQVQKIIDKGMAKERAQRFQSAAALVHALENLESHLVVDDDLTVDTLEPTGGTPWNITTAWQKWLKRGATPVVAFALLVLFGLAALVWGLGQYSPPEQSVPADVGAITPRNPTPPLDEPTAIPAATHRVSTPSQAPSPSPSTEAAVANTSTTTRPTATRTATPITEDPTLGWIAMSSARSGNNEIALMKADGSNYRQLTHHGDYCDEPDFSPDGEWIAYECKTGQSYNWEMYVIDRNGRNEYSLGEGRLPAWSPDGEWIAYETKDRDGKEQIWRMNLSNGAQEQLTWDDYPSRSPDWSPDGSHLVYMANIEGVWQIVVLNLRNYEKTILTTGGQDKRHPVWSPDAEWVAYNTLRGSAPDQIWIIKADGSETHQVTQSGMNGRPFWSPLGQYLAFNTKVDDVWQIARIRRDGSNYAIIFRGWGDIQPAWAP